MTTKRATKAQQLPKYGTLNRNKMMSYIEDLNKGPYFTREELGDLKDRYKEGLTWEDVERELTAKKLFLKKPTFRKYIQDGYLPEATSYRNTDKGRMAVFPADVISHINFIQYFYKIATGEIIDELFGIIRDVQLDCLEAVESKLSWTDNLVASIYHYITADDGDAEDAIKAALVNKPEYQREALARLTKIDEKFKSEVHSEINSLIGYLKDKKMFSFEIPQENTAEIAKTEESEE